MANTDHSSMTGTNIHVPYAFTYADQTAREAASLAVGDVGKFSRQSDDNSIWMLIDDSPTTWIQVGGAAGSVSRSGSTTDGHVAVWNGSNADSIKDGGAIPGGRALISESAPSGTGTVSFTTIPGTYKKLIIEGMVRSTNASNSDTLLMQFNGDTIASHYYRSAIEHWSGVAAWNANDNNLGDAIPGASVSDASRCCVVKIEIPQYANTAFHHNAIYDLEGVRDVQVGYHGGFSWDTSVAAITQINLVLGAGNFVVGSVLRLYGEN